MARARNRPTATDAVAIVTGGSCGLGRDIARTLASRRLRRGRGLPARPGAKPRPRSRRSSPRAATALAVRADVADELDVERLFDETTAAFGGVDVVVHTTVRRAHPSSIGTRRAGSVMAARSSTPPARRPSHPSSPASCAPATSRSTGSRRGWSVPAPGTTSPPHRRAGRCRTPGRPTRMAPSAQPATIVAASAIRWSFVQGGPIVARGPCRTSSARSASMLDRLTHHRLGVVEVDVPATSVCELGELLAIHDGVGPGLIRRATLDGDVVGEVGRPGSERDRDGSARAARLRSRRVRLTSPERRTLAPSRPAQP